jgi:putative transposase
LGRRFAAGFNRRHLRSGSLWDGRYRSTVIEPGRTLLDTMVFVDRLPTETMPADGDSAPALWSSARQHVGFEGPAQLKDTAEYWALGNTPFDRAAAYRALLAEALSRAQAERIETAARSGWALGSSAFLEWLQTRTNRPLSPRQRGRPRGSGRRPNKV